MPRVLNLYGRLARLEEAARRQATADKPYGEASFLDDLSDEEIDELVDKWIADYEAKHGEVVPSPPDKVMSFEDNAESEYERIADLKRLRLDDQKRRRRQR